MARRGEQSKSYYSRNGGNGDIGEDGDNGGDGDNGEDEKQRKR